MQHIYTSRINSNHNPFFNIILFNFTIKIEINVKVKNFSSFRHDIFCKNDFI